MENFEETCFQIISYAGEARSYFIEALRHAKDTDKSECRRLLDAGNESLIQAEKAHMQFVTLEANDQSVDMKLLLLHAEDIMMSADTMKALVSELTELL